MAVGGALLSVDGCLSPDRAESLERSLISAAQEVKEGSKEVINELGDRLEGVVEKIPTKFEIAPTEVKVTITSFKDGRLWLVGLFAFFGGFLCGMLFLFGFQVWFIPRRAAL